MATVPKPKVALGPTEEAPEESDEIADALEVATGKRPSSEAVEAFCLAVVMAMEKHGAGEY